MLTLLFPWAHLLISSPIPTDFQLLPNFRGILDIFFCLTRTLLSPCLSDSECSGLWPHWRVAWYLCLDLCDWTRLSLMACGLCDQQTMRCDAAIFYIRSFLRSVRACCLQSLKFSLHISFCPFIYIYRIIHFLPPWKSTRLVIFATINAMSCLLCFTHYEKG